jgi:hypothetical protein
MAMTTEHDRLKPGTAVYMVWHEIESETEGDRYTFIGVYSTEENAKRAVASLRDKPDFKATPDNFGIYENTVDRVGWPEGFAKLSANDPDGALGHRPRD